MGKVKELYLEAIQEEMEAAGISDYDEYQYLHFLKSYVPHEPYARYNNSIERLDEIAENSRHLADYPMFHRMMLVQHVAILEAYLADRLITLVTSKPHLPQALVLNHPTLKTQKYPLEAFVGNPNLVADKITTHLKSVLYHELELVADLYKAALGFDMLADQSSSAILKQCMIDRHHCVHRDGKDNLGRILSEINSEYIVRMRDSSVELVSHIEEQCDPWTGPPI
ncbi:hypothetical protein LB533_15150 [Mesorhizobium sp. BR1-1-13]|uniref:hypothetical protein n=1 Tax=Mesorhizobium sp. BR1-1-13 TaxID=2876656 RepID=UPI001CD10955|nr:hypothetical protein [Mesorhizobium sp. BR1-1-13]MBZ9942431.1 hypothetical protein [Mesorhizobium sp. BR1-1-13]